MLFLINTQTGVDEVLGIVREHFHRLTSPHHTSPHMTRHNTAWHSMTQQTRHGTARHGRIRHSMIVHIFFGMKHLGYYNAVQSVLHNDKDNRIDKGCRCLFILSIPYAPGNWRSKASWGICYTSFSECLPSQTVNGPSAFGKHCKSQRVQTNFYWFQASKLTFFS